MKKSLQKFWKKELKVSPQDLPKEEGQLETFWGEISKEEYSEKMKKGLATNVVLTLVLVSKAAN